ncbi:MAG TPA: Arc family DNA-binding protein [Chloroflexota bacterium]|nr:Arc family DNA-binding protein [Chloroflexota bacterium]
MAILHVRNVPDDLYERLKERAAAERRSISAEIIAILECQLPAKRSVSEVLDEVDRINRLYPLPPNLPDATELLREDHEQR